MPRLRRYVLPDVDGGEAGQAVVGQHGVKAVQRAGVQRWQSVYVGELAGQATALQGDAGQLVVGQRVLNVQNTQRHRHEVRSKGRSGIAVPMGRYHRIQLGTPCLVPAGPPPVSGRTLTTSPKQGRNDASFVNNIPGARSPDARHGGC